MPKEHVKSMFHDAVHPLIEMTGDGIVPQERPRGPYRVDVGWGTNDYVQIATTDPDAEPYTLESGLWVDLDRKGINDLIRLLRKARDRAYGRDE